MAVAAPANPPQRPVESPPRSLAERTRNSCCGCIGPQKLPDHLLGEAVASKLVGTIDGAQNEAVVDTRCTGPGVNGHFRPGGHGNRPDPPVLPDQVYDAPAVVAKLDMPEGQASNLGSAQPAAQEDG